MVGSSVGGVTVGISVGSVVGGCTVGISVGTNVGSSVSGCVTGINGTSCASSAAAGIIVPKKRMSKIIVMRAIVLVFFMRSLPVPVG
jgi:hypothetical protein